MAVTNYHSVNGEIIGETTTGSPRVDYLTDALGSVTATVNQSGSVVNTYRYTPFGSTLAKTGTGADPEFGWVGEQGYRPTGNKFSDFYVNARHYDELNGRWPTQDPIAYSRRVGNLYVYVGNLPVAVTDPSGLSPEDDLCAKWYNSRKWHSCKNQWNQCIRMCGGIDKVDHCCTDSWTNPVTSRECKCIKPQTSPPPTCKCGCDGGGGRSCTCGKRTRAPGPTSPGTGGGWPDQSPPEPSIQWPGDAPDWANCHYICNAVVPTVYGIGWFSFIRCNYSCILSSFRGHVAPPQCWNPRQITEDCTSTGQCPPIWKYTE